MLKPIRLKLLIVPVAVCLLLFVAFGGTALASSPPGTHPHLTGASQVETTYGSCVNIKVHGSEFYPSTTTTTNYAFLFTIASTDGQAFSQTALPVSSTGTFSGVFTVCYVTVSPDRIEYIAQDETTFFYSNTVFTTARF